MEFGDGVRAQEAWTRVRSALSDLVDAITLKEAAWRLGVDNTTLSKALDERDRCVLHARHLVVLLVTAPKKEQRALLSLLADACGFVVEEAPELTPEQRLEQLEESVRETFGKAGEALLSRIGARR